MADVTQILDAIEQGDPHAAEQLLPLVYDELRKLAAQRLAVEKPGQTLEATALVHEAYLRLADTKRAQHWESRGHFFAAAAEAMRRILIDQARRKRRRKHGGDRKRISLDQALCLGCCYAQTEWWACRLPNFAKGHAVGGRGEAESAMIAKLATDGLVSGGRGEAKIASDGLAIGGRGHEVISYLGKCTR